MFYGARAVVCHSLQPQMVPQSGDITIILETLEEMGIKAPEATVDIDEIRKKYHQAVEEEGADGQR